MAELLRRRRNLLTLLVKMKGGYKSKILHCDDGTELLLFRFRFPKMVSEDERHYNVYRVASGGKVLWRIHYDNPFELSTSTNGYFDNNKLMGYNWDSYCYEINYLTGEAERVAFER